MVKATYYKTSQDWLEQSAELLRARPTTTRITTKYSVKKPKPSSSTTAAGAEPAKRAFLTLKTFDPASGATLKFKTTKAAEVSRLISALGMLGRDMAGLPPVSLGSGAADAEAPKTTTTTAAAAAAGGNKAEDVAAAASATAPASGGKKKKKGKK